MGGLRVLCDGRWEMLSVWGRKAKKLTLVVCGEASDVEEAAGHGAG